MVSLDYWQYQNMNDNIYYSLMHDNLFLHKVPEGNASVCLSPSPHCPEVSGVSCLAPARAGIQSIVKGLFKQASYKQGRSEQHVLCFTASRSMCIYSEVVEIPKIALTQVH